MSVEPPFGTGLTGFTKFFLALLKKWAHLTYKPVCESTERSQGLSTRRAALHSLLVLKVLKGHQGWLPDCCFDTVHHGTVALAAGGGGGKTGLGRPSGMANSCMGMPLRTRTWSTMKYPFRSSCSTLPFCKRRVLASPSASYPQRCRHAMRLGQEAAACSIYISSRCWLLPNTQDPLTLIKQQL